MSLLCRSRCCLGPFAQARHLRFHRNPILKVRFDSLGRPDGLGSTRFDGGVAEIVAWSVDEVAACLDEVDRHIREGRHAAGFVCYEAAPAMDAALRVQPQEKLPLLAFSIFRDRIDGGPLEGLPESPAGYDLGPLDPEISRENYLASVAAIQNLIAAGDSYQVNFTFPLTGSFSGTAEALYRDLCQSQTAAYCALIEFGDQLIISASPELFFRRRGTDILMRPMKGTRPRGRWAAEDLLLATELRESEKDRAENLMIVDLLRNDLGRVAEFGSVEVPKLFEIEHYPTVHQMTSTVTGRIGPDVGVSALFRALFPSGSITGAPKVRTMEIIEELEAGPRGVYTGAIGFVSPNDAVFSVAIRTLQVDRTGICTLGVGSGITTDSSGPEEYAESIAKSSFVHRRRPDFDLLESLRYTSSGGFAHLDAHLQRLASSADYFDFDVDIVPVKEALKTAESRMGAGPCKVRLTVDRAGEPTVRWEEIGESEPAVRLVVGGEQVDSTDVFLYHKTTHRGVYERAESRNPHADEVILLNERGELTETTRSNLVLTIDGERWTPALECGLLPGVERAWLLARGEIREGVLTLGDLERATEIAVINSVRGMRKGVLRDAAKDRGKFADRTAGNRPINF